MHGMTFRASITSNAKAQDAGAAGDLRHLSKQIKLRRSMTFEHISITSDRAGAGCPEPKAED